MQYGFKTEDKVHWKLKPGDIERNVVSTTSKQHWIALFLGTLSAKRHPIAIEFNPIVLPSSSGICGFPFNSPSEKTLPPSSAPPRNLKAPRMKMI